jgi:hypothetical protein
MSKTTRRVERRVDTPADGDTSPPQARPEAETRTTIDLTLPENVSVEHDYTDLRGTSVYEPSRAPAIRRIVVWVLILAVVAAAVVFAEDLEPIVRQAVDDVMALFG